MFNFGALKPGAGRGAGSAPDNTFQFPMFGQTNRSNMWTFSCNRILDKKFVMNDVLLIASKNPSNNPKQSLVIKSG